VKDLISYVAAREGLNKYAICFVGGGIALAYEGCHADVLTDMDFSIAISSEFNDDIRFEIRAGNHGVVKGLIFSGIRIQPDDFLVAAHQHDATMLTTILDNVEDASELLNARDESLRTALHLATGSVACVTILLERGADKYVEDELGDTPADYAEFKGDGQSLELLK